MLGQLSVFTAGLWGVTWPILIAIACIAGLCALAYFSPIGKRYFIEAAVVLAVGLAVYQWGLHEADQRCRAQQIAGQKHINQVVNKAVGLTRTKKSRAQPDPWNQKDY